MKLQLVAPPLPPGQICVLGQMQQSIKALIQNGHILVIVPIFLLPDHRGQELGGCHQVPHLFPELFCQEVLQLIRILTQFKTSLGQRLKDLSILLLGLQGSISPIHRASIANTGFHNKLKSRLVSNFAHFWSNRCGFLWTMTSFLRLALFISTCVGYNKDARRYNNYTL